MQAASLRIQIHDCAVTIGDCAVTIGDRAVTSGDCAVTIGDCAVTWSEFGPPLPGLTLPLRAASGLSLGRVGGFGS
jgi:hypothetical protein